MAKIKDWSDQMNDFENEFGKQLNKLHKSFLDETSRLESEIMRLSFLVDELEEYKFKYESCAK